MSADCEIVLTDAVGKSYANGNLTKKYETLDYSLVANGIGPLTLTLPFDRALWPLIRSENRIEVWRKPEGGTPALEGGKSWIIRRPGFRIPEQGAETLTIQAFCCNTLLHRRTTAAYDAGEANYTSLSSAPLDDQMKLLMYMNFGAGATADRDISNYLTIDPFYSLAPADSKDCAQSYIDDIMRELAQTSEQLGTPLFFNVTWNGSLFVFRTHINQLGVDHRSPGGINPVVLGPEFRNLVDVEYYEDNTNEANYVYARGQGTGAARYDAFAEDTARQARSPIGRIEFFQDARGSSDAAVQGQADAALRRHAPRHVLTGRIQETPQTRYGIHWQWGDQLSAQIRGLTFDVRADVVHVTKGRGKGEQIQCPLQGVILA